jgi:hypothetical protein
VKGGRTFQAGPDRRQHFFEINITRLFYKSPPVMSFMMLAESKVYFRNAKTTPQAMAHTVAADIVFTDADASDIFAMHDHAGANPERIVAQRAGMYRISGFINIATEPLMDATLLVNHTVPLGATTVIGQDTRQTTATGIITLIIDATFFFNVGEYVSINVVQANTGTNAKNATGQITMVRVFQEIATMA